MAEAFAEALRRSRLTLVIDDVEKSAVETQRLIDVGRDHDTMLRQVMKNQLVIMDRLFGLDERRQTTYPQTTTNVPPPNT